MLIEHITHTKSPRKNSGSKAALVDREEFAVYQEACALLTAEELLCSAFWAGCSPLGAAWCTIATCLATHWRFSRQVAMLSELEQNGRPQNNGPQLSMKCVILVRIQFP